MSRNYDNWGKLVGAILRREKDRQLAYCESFDSSSSTDLSSSFSFQISISGDVHQPAVAEESRSSGQKIDHLDLSNSRIFFSGNARAIKYGEIRKATEYFGGDIPLKVGLSSCVYKGWIDKRSLKAAKPGFGIPVAVKIKKIRDSKDVELQKKWVDKMSHLGHPNLVTPIGYCFNGDETILVYKFMPNGSLDHQLFPSEFYMGPLPWATRIKVALGAARGLAFLHSLKTPIIYGKLKIDNILLDFDFEAKLSDIDTFIPEKGIIFGFGIDEDLFDMTRGFKYSAYAAPEYKATGQVSTKCDVYNFGFVLVQLISGLRASYGFWAAGKHNLIDWATPYLGDNNRLSEIMDSRLEGAYSHEQACKFAQLALQCVSSDPRSRPTMSAVAAALQQLRHPIM